MQYFAVEKGKFLSRPNRFSANVEINGKTEICHVKNTGRCGELLTSGASVYVSRADNPLRKTKYDLISAVKGDEIINIDSQAPNTVFKEWAESCDFFGDITLLKPECKYKNSRFDFYIESENRKIFVEVKGVNLKCGDAALFPDAPTERGIKHLNELMDCLDYGYEAFVFFIVQMEKCKYFAPNEKTHPEFAEVLKKAYEKGVGVKAMDCTVTSTELKAHNFLNVKLPE